MIRVIASLILLLAAATFTGGCERADYQHPLHRSTDK
jgi:hypothetical protein